LVQANRQQIVSAALTILKGYHDANITSRLGVGRTGSFDDWDDNVRQTVCWLADLKNRGLLPKGQDANDARSYPQLVDPFSAIDDAIDDDPTLLQLGRLLSAWEAKVGAGIATKSTIKHLIQTHGFPATTFRPGAGTNAESDVPSFSEVLAEIAGNAFTHKSVI